MKGKIKLVPIGIPKEEMQVVWNNKVFTFEEDFHCSPVRYSELDKIVVEYEDKWNRYTKLYMESIGDNPEDFKNIKIMPLHPEQWSWALAMIGHEVEFDEYTPSISHESSKDSTTYAKIVTPTPGKDYIEEKNLKAKEFISEHGLPDGWGKKKITGEDVAALLHGIHTHAGIIHHQIDHIISEGTREEIDEAEGKIYYAEDDLLPILKALGLPEPVWKNSVSLDEWLKLKDNQ